MNTEKAKLVGRDIQWDAINGKSFLVTGFIPLAAYKDGKIRGSIFKPYGYLTVDTADYELKIPIVHKVDFRVIWKMYEEDKTWDKNASVGLLTYEHRSSFWPRLHIGIAPRKIAEKISIGETVKIEDYSLVRDCWNDEGVNEMLFRLKRSIRLWFRFAELVNFILNISLCHWFLSVIKY